MTARGRQLAFLVGLLIVFGLPKRVDCGYPGTTCTRPGQFRHEVCTPYEIEPYGFYLIERLVGHDVGFAYSVHEDCL
jgi:hypothetical protein